MDFFNLAAVNARNEFARTLPAPPIESRTCEQCPKTAWFKEHGPDGLKVFQCASGHVKIVAPPMVAAS